LPQSTINLTAMMDGVFVPENWPDGQYDGPVPVKVNDDKATKYVKAGFQMNTAIFRNHPTIGK
jgi:hypothetical protein